MLLKSNRSLRPLAESQHDQHVAKNEDVRIHSHLDGISQHLNGMPSIEFKVFKGKNDSVRRTKRPWLWQVLERYFGELFATWTPNWSSHPRKHSNAFEQGPQLQELYKSPQYFSSELYSTAFWHLLTWHFASFVDLLAVMQCETWTKHRALNGKNSQSMVAWSDRLQVFGLQARNQYSFAQPSQHLCILLCLAWTPRTP